MTQHHNYNDDPKDRLVWKPEEPKVAQVSKHHYNIRPADIEAGDFCGGSTLSLLLLLL